MEVDEKSKNLHLLREYIFDLAQHLSSAGVETVMDVLVMRAGKRKEMKR